MKTQLAWLRIIINLPDIQYIGYGVLNYHTLC